VPQTDADRALNDDLAALGEPAAAGWELKALRKCGAIESPYRPGRGRTRGRRSVAYPEGTADRLVEARRLTRSGVRRGWTPVLLFLDGRAVPNGRLRQASLSMLDRLGSVLTDGVVSREKAERLG
jgi:hypothetical protein